MQYFVRRRHRYVRSLLAWCRIAHTAHLAEDKPFPYIQPSGNTHHLPSNHNTPNTIKATPGALDKIHATLWHAPKYCPAISGYEALAFSNHLQEMCNLNRRTRRWSSFRFETGRANKHKNGSSPSRSLRRIERSKLLQFFKELLVPRRRGNVSTTQVDKLNVSQCRGLIMHAGQPRY